MTVFFSGLSLLLEPVMKNTVLLEFQEFLESHNLIKKKYIYYYAYWSRKFLVFKIGCYLAFNGKIQELNNREFPIVSYLIQNCLVIGLVSDLRTVSMLKIT